MDENIEVTESDSVEDELEDVLGILPLENTMPHLNREEIKEWVEAYFDEPTEEILTGGAIIQSVIKPKAPEEFASYEDDVEESNNIGWNQADDAFNTFIKFIEPADRSAMRRL